jgi:hypothetical protein
MAIKWLQVSNRTFQASGPRTKRAGFSTRRKLGRHADSEYTCREGDELRQGRGERLAPRARGGGGARTPGRTVPAESHAEMFGSPFVLNTGWQLRTKMGTSPAGSCAQNRGRHQRRRTRPRGRSVAVQRGDGRPGHAAHARRRGAGGGAHRPFLPILHRRMRPAGPAVSAAVPARASRRMRTVPASANHPWLADDSEGCPHGGCCVLGWPDRRKRRAAQAARRGAAAPPRMALPPPPPPPELAPPPHRRYPTDPPQHQRPSPGRPPLPPPSALLLHRRPRPPPLPCPSRSPRHRHPRPPLRHQPRRLHHSHLPRRPPGQRSALPARRAGGWRGAGAARLCSAASARRHRTQPDGRPPWPQLPGARGGRSGARAGNGVAPAPRRL